MTWLDEYMAYTEGVSSPEIFRKWSGISCLGAMLERRVWCQTARGLVYPNQYIMLVAPPGIGKGEAIKTTEELWKDSKKLRVAPDSITSAALIDALVDAQKSVVTDGGKGLFEYHALAVPAEEFGVLCPSHDMEFMSVLAKIWNNPMSFRQRRRHMKDEIDISRPQLNILGGAQPGFLAGLLPDEAWTMGFMARVIMIYSGAPIFVDLFDSPDPRTALKSRLLAGLLEAHEIMGRFHFSPESMAMLRAWKAERYAPAPIHSKLQNYTIRRPLHLLKLCMIVAISRELGQGRDIELMIRGEDVNMARDFLLEAEVIMPDVFKEMAGKSDSLVLDELHSFLWKIWAMDKDKKPIHEARLYGFLSTRATSDKIPRLIETAERAGMVQSQDPGRKYWVPRPRNEHGME